MKENPEHIINRRTSCLTHDELFLYAEGKLSGDALRGVEEHVADCDLCSDALEGILSSGNIESLKKSISHVRNEIDEIIRKKKPKVFSLQRTIAIAASLILLVTVTWFIQSLNKKTNKEIFADQFKAPPAIVSPESPSLNEPTLSDRTPLSEKLKDEQKNSKGEKIPAPPSNLTKSIEANQTDANKQNEELPITIQDDSYELNEEAAPEQYQNAEQKEDIASGGIVADSISDNKTFSNTSNSITIGEVVTTESKKSKDKVNGNSDTKPEGYVMPTTAGAVIDADEAPFNIYFNTGIQYYTKKDYTTAISYFQKALEDDSANNGALFYAGVSELALDKPELALSFLQKITGSDIQYYEMALWYQSLAYIKLNNSAQAKPLLEKIISLKGEHKKQAEQTLKELK